MGEYEIYLPRYCTDIDFALGGHDATVGKCSEADGCMHLRFDCRRWIRAGKEFAEPTGRYLLRTLLVTLQTNQSR